jgi:hypothetical protein
MRQVQAPQEFIGDDSVIFLAGAVSDAENWQRQFMLLLAPLELVVLNPRRDNFPRGNSNAAASQIGWEHRHLSRADLVVFWFSSHHFAHLLCSSSASVAVRAPRSLLVVIQHTRDAPTSRFI